MFVFRVADLAISCEADIKPDAIGWLITLPFEITAAGLTINYWHEYNIGIWVAVFLTIIAIVQFFGVRGYGEGTSCR